MRLVQCCSEMVTRIILQTLWKLISFAGPVQTIRPPVPGCSPVENSGTPHFIETQACMCALPVLSTFDLQNVQSSKGYQFLHTYVAFNVHNGDRPFSTCTSQIIGTRYAGSIVQCHSISVRKKKMFLKIINMFNHLHAICLVGTI